MTPAAGLSQRPPTLPLPAAGPVPQHHHGCGVKYTFVTAIEACVDVAQHICASEGWGPPRDNADAVRVLGAHGVLRPDLANRLGQAVGFRNVLVREYSDVTAGGAGNQTDDRVVLARLADPSDLADFVAAIADWTSRDV